MDSKVAKLIGEIEHVEKIYNALASDNPTVTVMVGDYEKTTYSGLISDQTYINTIRGWYAERLNELKKELLTELNSILV